MASLDAGGSTFASLNESPLRQMYATPPPEFVAARNELVKQLRRDRQRDDASALAALRRPGWDDWALNRVAGTDGDVVAGFADAASAVREAQAAAIEGRDGPDIRAALGALRDRSAELVRLADSALTGAGRRPTPGELNARLSEVATSDVAVAQLRAGILGSGDAAPADLFGELEPGPRPAPARRAAAEKQALAEAERVHAAAVKARRRAEGEVDKAEAAVERARAALAAAEEALASARHELEVAVESEQAAADDAG